MKKYFKGIVGTANDALPRSEIYVVDGDSNGDESKSDSTKMPLIMRTPSQKIRDEIKERYDLVQRDVPDCYDKTISLLQLHFEYEKRNSESDSALESKLIDDLANALDVLKKQLGDDNLYEGAVKILHSKLTKLIAPNKIRSQIRKIIEELQRLVDTVRPLDLDLTMELIERSRRSATVVQDRDVVLLLGGTGNRSLFDNQSRLTFVR